MRAVAVLLAVCLSVGSAARAQAKAPPTNTTTTTSLTPPLSPEAQRHYQAGLAHYAARRYAEAIQELAAAWQLDPRREILFARAQATRLSGDCAAAIPLFEQFLATSPPARQVQATHLALSRCQQPPAAAASSTSPVTPSPSSSPSRSPFPTPVPATPHHRDLLGGTLVGAAVVCTAIAGGLLLAAQRADGRARQAPLYRDYEAARLQAERRSRLGGAFLIGAALLGTSAAGRYLWLGWRDGRAELAMGARF